MPMLPREMRRSAGMEEAQSPSPSRSQSPSPQREPSRFPSAKKLDHLEQAKQRRRLDRVATQAAHSPIKATAHGDGAAGAAPQMCAGSPMVPRAHVLDTDKAEVRRGRARNTDWSLEGTVSEPGGVQSSAVAGRWDLEGSVSSGMQGARTQTTCTTCAIFKKSALPNHDSNMLIGGE